MTGSHVEANLEQFFRRRVRLVGGRSSKITAEKGCPDRLVLMPGGRIYLVELKTERGRLEPAQVVWCQRAAALGTKVHVLYGKTGVLAWLRDITENHYRNQRAVEEFS